MLRRSLLALAAVLIAAVLLAAPVGAQDTGGDDEERLPGTTLEANQRDDGETSVVPWVIGSGIAALAVIGIGGWIVQRRTG
jgi:hypothetical protein